MAVKNPIDLFVTLLSHVKHNTEHTSKLFQEMSHGAMEPRIKEALEARIFVSSKVLATIDECFRLIGQPPVPVTSKIHDMFMEEFRKEVSDIQSPEARRLFILSKISQLTHHGIGAFTTLIAMSDLTGKFGIGVLLESCLADKLAFAERTRRFIKGVVEGKVVAKAAA